MGIKVLSLFDGMSCGQLALKVAGIECDKYYASEIDKNSIKVTMKNFPNTIQLGSVINLKEDELKALNGIDLLIGGSPCRNLTKSVQGETMNHKKVERGLKGDSALFFNFVNVLYMVNPKYFLFENVESMSDEDKNIISDLLGVEPVMIDSALFSAQSRKRYYWTNIHVKELPKQNNLVLKDILQPFEEVDEKYHLNYPYSELDYSKSVITMLDIKGFDIKRRVQNENLKAPTLTACRGGGLQKKIIQNNQLRKLTPIEYERLQTVPDNYTEGVADSHRYNMLGDGWSINTVAHILNGMEIGANKWTIEN